MSGKKIHVWLCVDSNPNGRGAPRIMFQLRPFVASDFQRHRGPNVGEEWAQREIDVDEATVKALLRADVTPTESDQLHQQWWNDAAPEGAPPWPTI